MVYVSESCGEELEWETREGRLGVMSEENEDGVCV